MSIRLEMLQVARLAPKILGDSTDLVRSFLAQQQNEDGGFRDRTGRSDLYYTVFGLEGLLAIQSTVAPERTARFLDQFGDGEGLDLVHLCCLARCRAALSIMGQGTTSNDWAGRVARRLQPFRAADGGFHIIPGSAQGTVYASFLAFGAWQDLGRPAGAGLSDPDGSGLLAKAILGARTKDGAWANERHVPIGATNATAAAVTLLRNLSAPVELAVGEWLWAQRHPQGGFRAVPGAPIPDLLSTATALHALSGLQRSFADIQEVSLDFVDSLWTNDGAFHGHWDDHHLDVEYTYYGLLALGHLSL